MGYRIVDPDDVPLGAGPESVSAPYVRRLSEALGVTGVELHQVLLPPARRSTDRPDDFDAPVAHVYVVLGGTGWVVVDGVEVAVGPGQCVAVDVDSEQSLRAGPRGLELLAIEAVPSPATSSRQVSARGGLVPRLRRLVTR